MVNYSGNVRIMEEIEEIWNLESVDIYHLATSALKIDTGIRGLKALISFLIELHAKSL